MKAVVTVKPHRRGMLDHLGLGIDDIRDLLGKSILLELVSSELDIKTGFDRDTIKGYAHRTEHNSDVVKYECKFEITEDFGEVGAILVENEHLNEMFVQGIRLDGLPNGSITFSGSSWVHSKFDNLRKRVFFTDKSFLPCETPSGLKRLREDELASLRGNGDGVRKTGDRIYDYDVYNDIGDPDTSLDLKRPVLGGKDHPYPRRCRTGRDSCKQDPNSETRNGSFYVPRDESFSDIKNMTFATKIVYSVVHALVPSLETAMSDSRLGFPYFTRIDELFNEGVKLPLHNNKKGFFRNLLPRLVKSVEHDEHDLLRFEIPDTMTRDRLFWYRDEEFGRQMLSGINPCVLQLVTEWPLRSKLDPTLYGPAESAMTTDMIEREIRGFHTIDQAIEAKVLFIVDYHDIFLPYVSRVREIEGTTLYGSRALFILTLEGTLKPVAIELVRPPMDGKPQWKQVFTRGHHSTSCWLWRFAKAHFLAHDSGIHQLVTHWLRTHACTEPYIIAANRQLSCLHPVYRLLHPHFRYTMEINAMARSSLINANGIIESTFSPAKYSTELSSVAYQKLWRFDLEALPKDLINRGMAVEDDAAPHGLKLTIEDYPYANDGLLIWDALKEWISDYINHYYPNPSLVASDPELQAWWLEIQTVGHGDKKDEPWWPELQENADLIDILTTITWVTSGHHAAVNFGQYTYGGYFPNRPTIARVKMPTEDPTEETIKLFLEKPEEVLLQCFPSQIQATKVMAVLDVLSSHSPDEEYLGEKSEAAWEADTVVMAAFKRFHERMKAIEGIMDGRNLDMRLKNRNGAGTLPYELLKPFSESGVTGKGVPYSISI